MSEIVPFTNPAEIARSYAEDLMMGGHLDEMTNSSAEKDALAELTQIAHEADMLQSKFYVRSYKSIITPATQETLQDVTITNFDHGLDYSGRFIGFSTVRIGKLMGGNAIRALCLAFEDTTLLPYFDEVPDDKWLFTPVHAVKEMDKRAA